MERYAAGSRWVSLTSYKNEPFYRASGHFPKVSRLANARIDMLGAKKSVEAVDFEDLMRRKVGSEILIRPEE